MFLLDTNVISELRKNTPHGAVLAWYQAQPEDELFLSSIVLFELQAGAEVTRRQDEAKAMQIEAWIDRIAASATVLPLDPVSARTAAKLMHGRPQALFEDALIAAIALTHGLTVATRNVRDFVVFGVPVVDPFLS